MGFPQRSIRTRVATFLLAAVAVFATAPTVGAQDRLAPQGGAAATLTDGTEPVLVVTLGSINKLMQDIDYVTGVAGQPQAGGMFRMLAGTFTMGLNLDQPIGVILPMVGGAPEPLITIPTADIRTVLKRLEAQTGPVDELDDGTLVITVNQNTVYIKQGASWAVGSRNRDALKLVPADPTGLFAGMGNAYDLAFRLKVQQVPQELRSMLISQIRQGFEQAMQQQAQNEQQAREMAEASINQLDQLVQQSDQLNLGWNIDQSQRRVVVDVSFTAVPGSDMAAVYAGQKAIPSRFASVIREDAAAYFHSAVSVSPQAVAQSKMSIDSSLNMIRNAISSENNLSDEQMQEISEVMDRVAELIMETLEEGKTDSGMLLLADATQFRAVFGMFVSDGNKVAELVKDLAAKVPANEPKAPKFRFDIGAHSGVTMHVIEADVPASEDEVRKVFGDKIQVHIGTADKAIYLALGKDSESMLKGFIDSGSNTKTGNSIGVLRAKLLPILQFAQSVEQNDEVAAVISALSTSDDQGEFIVTSDSIPNGGKSQISIGEGLIKAIGAAAAANQPRGAAPF